MLRLCGHLGRTKRELLAELPERDLAEWDVFEKIHGRVGGTQRDLLLGMLASAVITYLGGHVTLKDLVPWLPDEDELAPPQSATEQARAFDAVTKTNRGDAEAQRTTHL